MADDPRGGYLLYRCRACGRLVRSPFVPDLARALDVLAFEDTGRCSHDCDGSTTGIADMIGGVRDGPAAPTIAKPEPTAATRVKLAMAGDSDEDWGGW